MKSLSDIQPGRDLRIVTRKLADSRRGETIFIAINDMGAINRAATQFLTSIRLEPDATRQQYGNAICHLHIACELLDIKDVEFRLSYAEGLSRSELDDLNFAFGFFASDLRRLAKAKREGARILNIRDAICGQRRLKRESEIVRKISIIKYLEWLMNTGDAQLGKYLVPENEIFVRREAFKDIKECIKIPSLPSGGRISRFKSSDLAALKQAIESYDPTLIWKDPFIAARNRVMFDLMYYGGLRKSEVLLLYNNDIVPPRAGGTIEIRIESRRNDPTDPRKPSPATKTGPGVVTLPDFVFNRIVVYQKFSVEIRDHADELGLTENLRHRFLIIAGNPSKASYGSPLSITGFDAAFKSFLAGVQLNVEVSPHALRHLCATNYVVRRRKMGAKDDAIQNDMRQFFRWSATSTMPQYYTSSQINADLYDATIQKE